MKVIFMGTPDFAVPALKALIYSNDHQVVAVFTASPKPKGRGLKVIKSPIHILAEQNNIDVYTPKSLRKGDAADIIDSIKADIIVVVAYGFIIPEGILESKKYGCLNIHPSKLPKYRGAAPLQRTIINGDKETAVCIMQMDVGLDTGDIIMQQDIDLDNKITLMELHDKCANIGADLLIKTLDNIDDLPKIKQSEEGLLYAEKLSKEEGEVNWNDTAFQIYCKIRGMNPWPGVFFEHNGVIIKILEAEIIDETKDKVDKGAANIIIPGSIMNDNFDVKCGDGALRLIKIKPSGKSEMSAKDYLRGSKNTNFMSNRL